MNDESREALNAYYAEADSWARDQRDASRNSRRLAWIIAGGACALAVLEAAALIALTPLKTIEPYTLMVDKQTGFVQALNPLDPQTISGDKALTQSFLVQYVIARESFAIDALQVNYRKVALWSADSARSSYISQSQISNPQSPLARYPRSTVVETRVKSVSPIDANVAMVRFETVRRDAGAEPRPPEAWVATIRYRYSGEPMRMEDRMVNPLGFEVLRYQRSAEMLNPTEAAAATPAPTASAASLQGAGQFPRPVAVTVQPAPPATAVTATATGSGRTSASVAVTPAPAPAPTPVQLVPAPVREPAANQNRRNSENFGPGNRGGFQGNGNNVRGGGPDGNRQRNVQ